MVMVREIKTKKSQRKETKKSPKDKLIKTKKSQRNETKRETRDKEVENNPRCRVTDRKKNTRSGVHWHQQKSKKIGANLAMRVVTGELRESETN